jgi:hypothetical protein
VKQNRDQFELAQERFFSAFGNFFLNLINLRAFYGTTTNSLNLSENGIEQQWRKEWEAGRENPEVKKAVSANPLMQSEDFINGILQASVKRSVRIAKQGTHSATLVFAHTILDGIFSECCEVSFLASSSDWYSFVGERKVKLGNLKNGDSDSLHWQEAQEFVRQLSRESMLKRFEYLHKICVPKLQKSELITAWIKRERLEHFDLVRHRVIHGRSFAKQLDKVEDQIHFAMMAGISMLLLVNQSYKLLETGKFTPKTNTLRLFVTFRREFPEFEDLFKKFILK